jgi:hypothetical protein
MGVALDEAQMVDGMNAMARPRLDRVGRILVRLGSLLAAVFVALPVFLYAVVILTFADSSATIDGQMSVAALMVFAVAVVVTVVMMLRGGTLSLALGSIGAIIVGSVALVLTTQQDIEWFVFIGQVALVAASSLALALGAALRLIARQEASGTP